ncbi:MAG: hypothetical protein AUK48_01625 [Oscillatoriales cyanobacterium CG2_30_44_21]|nr:MAG: hypothetical protein AUK48_01625 [Oscillatoriales cyanobacterium CG2_30_44_21]
MKSRRLFVYVWRANAVIIFVAGLLASLLLSASAFYSLLQFTRNREISNVVTVPNNNPSPKIDQKISIGTFEQVAGSDILRGPVYLIQAYDYRTGSKESSSIQNYIFFNPNTKSSNWLRPTNQGLLLSAIALSDRTNLDDNKQAPTISYLYLVADQDTNNDKQITDRDKKQIAISDASGTRFKVITEQIDQFNGTSAVKGDRLSIIYQADDKLKAIEVNLRSQEIVNSNELSIKPN